jgi:hypothetical protein
MVDSAEFESTVQAFKGALQRALDERRLLREALSSSPAPQPKLRDLLLRVSFRILVRIAASASDDNPRRGL